jgi:molybdopterin-guanine dinucleotide biosynthesis protein A
MAVGGIILAGGLSSRMGQDKALLKFNNETLIERTVNKLRSFAAEIVIASNRTAKYNLPGTFEVADKYVGMGPLGGMHAGLTAIKSHHAFIVSCDMPFFTPELADSLFARAVGYDIVVPEIRQKWEPLCAIYSKNCIEPIENCLRSSISKVYAFYPEVNLLKINETQLRQVGDLQKMFCNLNTPEDLKKVSRREDNN